MYKIIKLSALLLFFIFLTACNETSQSTKSKTNQQNYLEVYTLPGDWAKNGEKYVTETMTTIENSLKNGDIIAFYPQKWGNERLPLYFVNHFCDTNYQVIMNNSGVICTYTDVRLKKWYNDKYKKSEKSNLEKE